MHSDRKRRGPYKRKPLSERFWPKVAKSENGCWLWAASQTTTGYGQILSGGHAQYGATMLKAHRVAWELTYGPIPEGFEVCHKCDVRLCVRPDHLFLGSHADNMADMSAKGYHGNRKLTMDEAREIRRLYATGTIGAHRLAARYGVAKPQIFKIINGTHYKEAA